MKRFAFLTLALLLCLSSLVSCGSELDEDALSSLRSSAENWEKDEYSADFCLNMRAKGLEKVLFFSQGNYGVTNSESGKKLDAKMSIVSLGLSAESTASWENGVMTSVTAGTEVKSEMTENELFGTMIYVKPFVPDDKYISGCEKLTTGAGSGVAVKLKNAVDILYPLLGEDVFDLASIYKPRCDMTKAENAEIIYTLNGGVITGMKISFTLKVYDTPPYVPGGNDPDPEDYALKIEVSFNVEYK